MPATAGVVALRIVVQFSPPSVDCNTPDAGDARVQDARGGRRGRVQYQRAYVPGGSRALGPVEAAIGGNEEAEIGREVDGLVVGRIDDDDVDDLIEEDVRVARGARRIA